MGLEVGQEGMEKKLGLWNHLLDYGLVIMKSGDQEILHQLNKLIYE